MNALLATVTRRLRPTGSGGGQGKATSHPSSVRGTAGGPEGVPREREPHCPEACGCSVTELGCVWDGDLGSANVLRCVWI
jgi:hypothetical protein